MKTTLKRLIALAAIALTTAVLLRASQPQTAVALVRDGSVTFIANSIFGMALGETARFCVGSTNPRTSAARWWVRLSRDTNAVLYQTPELLSPSGEWRCTDIPRSALADTGDPGTGRVQVAATVFVEAAAGTKATDLVGTADIIVATGATGISFELTLKLENTLISPFQA